MKPFKFLTDNKLERVITREEVIQTVTDNMQILYDGRARQSEIDDMIEQVCRNLNIN